MRKHGTLYIHNWVLCLIVSKKYTNEVSPQNSYVNWLNCPREMCSCGMFCAFCRSRKVSWFEWRSFLSSACRPLAVHHLQKMFVLRRTAIGCTKPLLFNYLFLLLGCVFKLALKGKNELLSKSIFVANCHDAPWLTNTQTEMFSVCWKCASKFNAPPDTIYVILEAEGNVRSSCLDVDAVASCPTHNGLQHKLRSPKQMAYLVF